MYTVKGLNLDIDRTSTQPRPGVLPTFSIPFSDLFIYRVSCCAAPALLGVSEELAHDRKTPFAMSHRAPIDIPHYGQYAEIIDWSPEPSADPPLDKPSQVHMET
jgi:hypothetical protein